MAISKQVITSFLVLRLLTLTAGWEFDNSNTWLDITSFEPNFPNNAVAGGWSTINGYTFYVGRVLHNNSVAVARVISEKGYAHFDRSGLEMTTAAYAVLIENGNFTWKKSFDGDWEANAVSVGTDYEGRQVFVCRVICSTGLIPGQLTRGFKTCVVSNNYFKCLSLEKYEILLKNV